MPRAYKGKKTVKLKSNRGAAKRFRATAKGGLNAVVQIAITC